jgi:hypothetical protein
MNASLELIEWYDDKPTIAIHLDEEAARWLMDLIPQGDGAKLHLHRAIERVTEIVSDGH